MSYEMTESEPWKVEEEAVDLRERSKSFALRVVKMYSALPKITEAQVLGKQVLRSGTSVDANYREAYRSRSTQEFIAKIGLYLQELEDVARQREDGGINAARVERGEHLRVPFGRKCEQTSYWMELLVDADILPVSRLTGLQDECNQLLAIFTTISKKAKSNPS